MVVAYICLHVIQVAGIDQPVFVHPHHYQLLSSLHELSFISLLHHFSAYACCTYMYSTLF